MPRLRRYCWSLLVWVTTISTLAANCPHMTCACAQPATVEMAAAAQVQPCCCCSSQSDSPDAEVGNVERKSCCHDDETSSSNESSPQDQKQCASTISSGHDDPSWRLPSCRKALTQSENFTLESKEKDAKQVVSHFMQACEVVFAPSTKPARMERDGTSFSPPTDLITLFQHLLI